MRLWWNHRWKSSIYRRATAAERRLIEIRYCVAYTLKRKRRASKLTQAELAARIGITRNTVSRIERASNRVSLDHAVRALISLPSEVPLGRDVGANAAVIREDNGTLNGE